jgi:hypothetical protein
MSVALGGNHDIWCFTHTHTKKKKKNSADAHTSGMKHTLPLFSLRAPLQLYSSPALSVLFFCCCCIFLQFVQRLSTVSSFLCTTLKLALTFSLSTRLSSLWERSGCRRTSTKRLGFFFSRRKEAPDNRFFWFFAFSLPPLCAPVATSCSHFHIFFFLLCRFASSSTFHYVTATFISRVPQFLVLLLPSTVLPLSLRSLFVVCFVSSLCVKVSSGAVLFF